MAHRLSSRCANRAVNFSGMCWTTTMPGDMAGRWVSTASSAWVPPVEVPIATTRSVVRCKALPACGAGAAWGWIWASGRRLSRAGLARLAARTAWMMSLLASCRNVLSPMRGLVTMPAAPAANACMVVSAPCSVSVEQITTGVGRSAMILRRKVTPSMRGISTSSTITSGQSCFIFSRANTGSGAVPVTVTPGAPFSTDVRTCRTTAESSTIMTLMLIVLSRWGVA